MFASVVSSLPTSRGELRRIAILEQLVEPKQKSQLARDSRVGWGTLSHHLHVLSRRKQVFLHRVGRSVVVATDVMEPSRLMLLHAQRDAGQRRTLGLLCHQPLTVKEIMEQTAAGREVVRRQLRHLTKAGLVHAIGQHPKRYKATQN